MRLISRPRVEGWPLATIGLLLLSTLVFAGWSAHQKRQAQAESSQWTMVPSLAERAVRFADGPDSDILVTDARTGQALAPIVGEAGFARSVLRSLAQARLRAGGDPSAPFILQRGADDSLHIHDPLTQRGVDLTALGSTNAAVFSIYLQTPVRNIHKGDAP
ncbi:MAG: hypothetical protein RLZZ290_883 [Pseudomonadota bacterium]|jgi:putative photosynthetic complex assembly protein